MSDEARRGFGSMMPAKCGDAIELFRCWRAAFNEAGKLIAAAWSGALTPGSFRGNPFDACGARPEQTRRSSLQEWP